MIRHNIIFIFLVGVVAMSALPQGVISVDANGHAVIKEIGANSTNGSEYLSGVAHRIQLILGVIGGVIIAVMWLWIGIEYHMANPQRREELKEKIMYALIGTIIIAMAVGGIIWLLAQWIAGV